MRRETSIARHVSRYIRFGQKASRYSFVGKERYLWIANFTFTSVCSLTLCQLQLLRNKNEVFFIIIINHSSHSILDLQRRSTIFVSLLKFTHLNNRVFNLRSNEESFSELLPDVLKIVKRKHKVVSTLHNSIPFIPQR